MSSYDKLDALRVFLSSLKVYKGLKIYQTDVTTELKELVSQRKTSIDMDDAIQYQVALDSNAEAIISFDKHFNHLKIPRKDPKEIA